MCGSVRILMAATAMAMTDVRQCPQAATWCFWCILWYVTGWQIDCGGTSQLAAALLPSCCLQRDHTTDDDDGTGSEWVSHRAFITI